MFITLYLYLQD